MALKKKIICIVMITVMIILYMPAQAFAKEDVYSGECGTCHWEINGTTMTFSSGELDDWNSGGNWLNRAPWSYDDYVPYDIKQNIEKIVFEGPVKAKTCRGMFWGFSKLNSLDLTLLDTSECSNMSEMFRGCEALERIDVSGFDTSNVTNMDGMFIDCSKLTDVDVSGFDTSNVTILSGMFAECKALKNIDVSGFDTSNATDMGSMFGGCEGLESIDVSGFNTSNVTNMGLMFNRCKELESIDVSGFDTSNATDMGTMFGGCEGLESIDVSGFNTSNVTGISGMFRGCSTLTEIDVSGFDTSNVTNMSDLFNGCSSLTRLDLSNFDTSKVKLMQGMVANCSSLQYIDLSSFTFDKADNYCVAGFFNDCRSLQTLIIGAWKPTDLCTFPVSMRDTTTDTVYKAGEIIQGLSNRTYVAVESDDSAVTKLTLDDLWSFSNPSIVISIKKFTDLFGVAFGIAQGIISDPKSEGGGICHGMCQSALAITHKNLPSLNSLGLSSLRDVSMQGAIDTPVPNMNMSLFDFIQYAHIYQFTKYWQQSKKDSFGKYDELYDKLIDYFYYDGEPLIITLEWTSRSMYHALLPLSVKKEDNNLKIGLYDCTDPDHVHYITLLRDGDHVYGFSGEVNNLTVSNEDFRLAYTCPTNDFLSDIYASKYEPPGNFLVRLSPQMQIAAKEIRETSRVLHFITRITDSFQDGDPESPLFYGDDFGYDIPLDNVPSGESVGLAIESKYIEVIPGEDASVVMTPESSEQAKISINSDTSATNTINVISGEDADSTTMITVTASGQNVEADADNAEIKINGADQIEVKRAEGELTETGQVDGEAINIVSETDLDPSQMYTLDTETGNIEISDDPDPDSPSEPVHTHSYGKWTTKKAATELAAGIQVRKCSVCGKIETKAVAKLRPSLKAVKILAPKAAKKAVTVKWKKIKKNDLKRIKKVEIQYSTDKNFKKNVKTKYAKASKTAYKIKNLKKGKKYYIRIRAYTKSGGKVHISKWSAVKKVKVK